MLDYLLQVWNLTQELGPNLLAWRKVGQLLLIHFLLHEQVVFLQWLGIILIISAIVLMNIQIKKQSWFFDKQNLKIIS